MSERPWYREPAAFFAEAAFEEQPMERAEVAVRPTIYAPQPMPVAPLPRVRTGMDGVTYYAHVPAPAPAYDPLPQRMYGCGVMAFGILAGAGVAEAGSYWMFAGMALATHALIGIGATFVGGAVAVVALRMSGGVRIGHFHQGDNSTFRTGR